MHDVYEISRPFFLNGATSNETHRMYEDEYNNYKKTGSVKPAYSSKSPCKYGRHVLLMQPANHGHVRGGQIGMIFFVSVPMIFTGFIVSRKFRRKSGKAV